MLDPISTTTAYCDQCAAHPVPVATLGHQEPVTVCRECLEDAIRALDERKGPDPPKGPGPPFFDASSPKPRPTPHR